MRMVLIIGPAVVLVTRNYVDDNVLELKVYVDDLMAKYLAGAVVEVMGTRGAVTIRVTTPTTTSGDVVASAQFTYIKHGDGYAGW